MKSYQELDALPTKTVKQAGIWLPKLEFEPQTSASWGQCPGHQAA